MFADIKKKINRAKLKDKDFDFLFDEKEWEDEAIVLDTETTGLNPKKDEILSIGAVKIKDNKILISETFEVFVKPSKKISEKSIKIHQIRECDLQNAIAPKEAIFKLLKFIKSRPIVGYYIKFDIAILNRYIKSFIGADLPNELIEISSMYFKRKKKHSPYEFIDLKFDTIMEELDIPKLGQHDALNDSIMTGMIYLKLKNIPEYKGAFS